ncbi:MAG: hypothetical protein LUH51_04950 [Firmicutes bacterium]|nr:hypothetical protein [Bacillota bacterium]
MKPDIYLNGTSMNCLGWLRESIDFPTPQSQTNTIVVPGRNSPVRYTEALGRVSYNPRSFTITLTMPGTRQRFHTMAAILANTYAGQLTEVVTSEEPDLYFVGTLQLTLSYDPLTGKGQVVISCEDGDAYRYHVDETVVAQAGSGTVALTCDYMPVVPTVTTTEETALSWTVDGDSFYKSVSAGTWTFPELELAYGKNSIAVTTSGTVTFTYREGRL